MQIAMLFCFVFFLIIEESDHQYSVAASKDRN